MIERLVDRSRTQWRVFEWGRGGKARELMTEPCQCRVDRGRTQAFFFNQNRKYDMCNVFDNTASISISILKPCLSIFLAPMS